MSNVSRGFLTTSVIYGILGMVLGLHMAISQNHGQMPTHAHMLVVGWVSFALFGLFYHQFDKNIPQIFAKVHFWLAQTSFATLIVALYILYSGNEAGDPIAAIGSIGYAFSFVLFGIIVFGATKK